MSHTVGALRNEIRTAVDRFERPASAGFTKESLAAVCEALGYEIDETGRLPPTAEMRAGILWTLGEIETDDPELADRPLRKAELQAVLEALEDE